MYCHHCNREPCECVAGTYAASTNMTPLNTKQQISDEDRELAEKLRQLMRQNGDSVLNLSDMVTLIAAYRHRITELSDASIESLCMELKEAKLEIQQKTDALRAAEKAMQDFVDKCDNGNARSVRSYAAFKEALALIQPLLKD